MKKRRPKLRVVMVPPEFGGIVPFAVRGQIALELVARMIESVMGAKRRCVRCGASVEGKRVEAIYCSRRCKERMAQTLRRGRCHHCRRVAPHVSLCADGHRYCDGCLSCISD